MRKRHTIELKRQVGKSQLVGQRGSQKIIAQHLGISPRTLRSWKKKAKCNEPEKKLGRPKTEISLTSVKLIWREWMRQGKVGERPVSQKLKTIQVRVVRAVVAAIKKHEHQRHLSHLAAHRVRVKVQRPGVMTVMDAAQNPQKGGELIMFRDRGSLKTGIKNSEGVATTAQDTLKILRDLKEQSCLPLVLGTDNGTPFVAEPIRIFLEENKIVHLKSLPYVPEQNGSAEHGVGETKDLLAQGHDEIKVCQILNECRLRQTLNWKTPLEVERDHPVPYTQEFRERFYTAAKAAIQKAQLGIKTAYQKRKVEREAIFQTLEDFMLITRTRGRPCA